MGLCAFYYWVVSYMRIKRLWGLVVGVMGVIAIRG